MGRKRYTPEQIIGKGFGSALAMQHVLLSFHGATCACRFFLDSLAYQRQGEYQPPHLPKQYPRRKLGCQMCPILPGCVALRSAPPSNEEKHTRKNVIMQDPHAYPAHQAQPPSLTRGRLSNSQITRSIVTQSLPERLLICVLE